MSEKTKTIPFDLDKAKQGAKVVTRGGYSVRIVDYNIKDKNFPILGVIAISENKEEAFQFKENGNLRIDDQQSRFDLFLEEKNKVRRMTHKELAYWLSPIHGHFRQCITECGNIVTTLLYSKDEENDEVANIYKLIREDFGEWEEPLVEE